MYVWSLVGSCGAPFFGNIFVFHLFLVLFFFFSLKKDDYGHRNTSSHLIEVCICSILSLSPSSAIVILVPTPTPSFSAPFSSSPSSWSSSSSLCSCSRQIHPHKHRDTTRSAYARIPARCTVIWGSFRHEDIMFVGGPHPLTFCSRFTCFDLPEYAAEARKITGRSWWIFCSDLTRLLCSLLFYTVSFHCRKWPSARVFQRSLPFAPCCPTMSFLQ